MCGPGTIDNVTRLHEASKTRTLTSVAGFSLPLTVSLATMTYQQYVGIYVGTWEYQHQRYQQKGLSAASINRLSSATSDKEALLARAVGLCEVLLSQVARVECLTLGWADYEGGFAHLTEFESGQPCNPGRQLFSRVRSLMGAKTLAELLKQAASHAGYTPDERTVKRWSAGREFPRSEKLDQFIDSINAYRATTGDVPVPYARIQAQYWAAKRLQKLLELARLPWEAEPQNQDAHRPWSEMMNHDSAEAWIKARYPFWQKHWKHHFRASGQEADEQKG